MLTLAPKTPRRPVVLLAMRVVLMLDVTATLWRLP